MRIVQGIDSKWDRPTQITLGEWIPSRPAVYTSVRMLTASLEVRLWCFFHRHDWSKTGGLIGRLESHDFDFEGVLRYRIMTNYCRDDTRPFGYVTVFHKELKFYRSFQDAISIEPQGHGIYLAVKPPKGENCRSMYVDDMKDIDMDEPRRLAWLKNTVQPIFNRNSVNMPWQWSDWLIRRKFGKKTDGLIYSDPIKLIGYAIRANKIRRKNWKDILNPSLSSASKGVHQGR